MNEDAGSEDVPAQDWVPVAVAAAALGVTERHLRRRCAESSIEARRDSAGRWLVAGRAVPARPDARPDMTVDVRVHRRTDDGGGEFSELELFALRSELAQLRLQLQAVEAERDEARRAERRAVTFAESFRRAFEVLSAATTEAMRPTEPQRLV